MRNIYKALVISLAIICIACSKEKEPETYYLSQVINPVETGIYEKEFAVILSKAIYDSEPIRSFIKAEALTQFDNDFDVLYGLVKDKDVIGGRSFRETLLQYCESENQLEEIENALPLLNILVPNVSWLSKDGFSASNWDTSDNEIVVTYRDNNGRNEYFGNGEVVCELDDTQIPGFPVLIIKNNERLTASGNTRSGITYNFKSDAYNGSQTRGGTKNYNGTVVPTMVGNAPTVTAAQLRQVSQIAYNAYDEFGSNSSIACQRDYCYYQMTNDNLTNGVLQRNVYEKLFRFKLNWNNLNFYDDDNGDPLKRNIDTTFIYYKGENSIVELTPNEVQSYGAQALDSDFFMDGNFEIVVNCIYQQTSGQSIQIPYYFTIAPSELFEFNNVRFYYIHSSFWRKAKYTYVFDKNNIVSKWYYPETDIFFFNWGLGTKAVDYYLEIMEHDSGDTLTYNDTFSFSTTSNITTTIGTNEIKTQTGIGSTTTQGYQVSRSHTETSDLISRILINFGEDFVLNRTISGNDTLFTLRNYDNNSMSTCIIPAIMY